MNCVSEAHAIDIMKYDELADIKKPYSPSFRRKPESSVSRELRNSWTPFLVRPPEVYPPSVGGYTSGGFNRTTTSYEGINLVAFVRSLPSRHPGESLGQ